jgi:hypothetical protein
MHKLKFVNKALFIEIILWTLYFCPTWALKKSYTYQGNRVCTEL